MPDGWVVLNADDPLVAAVARRVRAQGCAVHPRRRRVRRGARHRERGGRAYLVRDGALVEANGAGRDRDRRGRRVPITIGGLARHNVANALAAAGGARGLGATIAEVRDGLIDFAPDAGALAGPAQPVPARQPRSSSSTSPTTRRASAAVLDVAQGIAAGAAGRAAPITAIIGTAGDRPDDTLRGIGRIAAERAQRVAIKQTLKYLRGRTAESVVGELLAGIVAGGGIAADVPIYDSETEALQAELNGAAGAGAHGGRSGRGAGHRADVPRGPRRRVRPVARSGARPVDVASELTELVPRLQGRPRRRWSASGEPASGSPHASLGGDRAPPARPITTSALGRLELARVGERRPATRRPGGGHRRAVDADRVVHAAHDEVARDRPAERGPDRGHLVEDLLGAAGPGRPGALRLADALDARWPRSRRARGRAGSCPRGR